MALWAGMMSAAAADLEVSPSGPLSVSGPYKGPYSVTNQVYTITNTTTETISWSASKDRTWISLSQNTGSLDEGQSATVTVRINALAYDLPATNDTATVNFINLGTFDIEARQIQMSISVAGPATTETQQVTATNAYRVTLTGQLGSTYILEDAALVDGPYSPVVTNKFLDTTAVYDFARMGEEARFFRAVSSGAGAVAANLTLASVQLQDNSLVRVTGEANGVYLVEGTTNSLDWIPVYTNKMPVSGEFTFTNTVFDADENVAYRAVAVGALDLAVLNHVVIAGESLALGFDGVPALSVAPSQQNFRVRSDGNFTFFTPLAEIGLETIASGAADQVVSQAPLQRMLMSNIGKQGAGYDQQKKGTTLYELGVNQFRDAPLAASLNLFGYRPAAIFVVGGEADQVNASYAGNVRQWQADYEKDIQFLTGFTGRFTMFHSQISAWTSPFSGSRSTAVSPYQILEESEASPSRTVLVCPKYFLPYAGAGASFPGLHLSNEGYRWLGEYYGKAFKRVVVDAGTWTPLRPSTVTRSGNVITAVFSVPEPPLVLDTTQVSDPGHFGFEFHDDSGAPPTISSVTLTGPDTVQIELSGVPTGGNPRLRYAYTGIIGNPGGPTTGPRGNLRDSDATPSRHGSNLFNWCVHFDKPVN